MILVCNLASSVSDAAQDVARTVENDVAIQPTNGPIVLFNKTNLKGFSPWIQGPSDADPKRVFAVVNGMLRISGEANGGLLTQQSYRDYHLVMEFKWGEKTHGARKKRARDAGVLVHGWGPDGCVNNIGLASIEAQIIEGGVGDLLVHSGTDPNTRVKYPVRVTASTITDRDGETVWKRGGKPVTLTQGRVNWWGRDWNWTDTLGFRWREDRDSPHGEWTRVDIISKGNTLQFSVNGGVVNQAYNVKPNSGKIVLQSALAEWYVRRLELWPIGKAPAYQPLQKASQPTKGSSLEE